MPLDDLLELPVVEAGCSCTRPCNKRQSFSNPLRCRGHHVPGFEVANHRTRAETREPPPQRDQQADRCVHPVLIRFNGPLNGAEIVTPVGQGVTTDPPCVVGHCCADAVPVGHLKRLPPCGIVTRASEPPEEAVADRGECERWEYLCGNDSWLVDGDERRPSAMDRADEREGLSERGETRSLEPGEAPILVGDGAGCPWRGRFIGPGTVKADEDDARRVIIVQEWCSSSDLDLSLPRARPLDENGRPR